MRICYVSHSSSHFTRPYVDYFSRRGHEVHLVSFLGPGLPNAINHHPLGKRPELRARKFRYLMALSGIRALVRSLGPCLVHAHYLSSNGVVAAFSGCRPLIVSAHGSDLQALWNPVRRAALRYALRRAHLVNPVSRAFERTLLALGVPAGKMLTLSQGVESARFLVDRTARPAGPIRLICTRSLGRHYNGSRVVRALALLKARGVPFRFTFAAGGPQETRLRRQVERRGLATWVTFLGGYRQEDLPEMLAMADVYVSASFSDGTSISLLEAMASGVFPVVSDIAGNREWLSGDGDSLLFHPNDEIRLTDCLQGAIQDEYLRRGAGPINRAKVEERGQREKNLARLEEIYGRLWEDSRRVPLGGLQ